MIAKMRRTPRDWRIESLISVAKHYGLTVRNPNGSHVVFSFPDVLGEACVPAHRPIKPVYVEQFLTLLDAVIAKEE